MTRCTDGDPEVGMSTRRSVMFPASTPVRSADFSDVSVQAYVEFFASPSALAELAPRLERDPAVTYYAVNKNGDLRTNTTNEGPNAVTWGVFPGKEIVQPTIVEALSFMAWKDEAFELGHQWADVYEEGSKSRAFVREMMDTFFLVNIVNNDFREADADDALLKYFRSSPKLVEDATSRQTAKLKINGH